MRIYNLVEDGKVFAVVSSPDVAVESLRISYSAFEHLSVKETLTEIYLTYMTLGCLVCRRYTLEPVDLITAPQHL